MQVRSACAPCARNQHPVCLITQVHTLRSATCAIQHVPARLITQVHTLRGATCAMDFVPRTQRPLENRTRRQRKPSNPTCCMSRFLIVRDPRRSQLRRSTRSTICPSRVALLDAVTAMFGRSLRFPLALCSAIDAVATICPLRAALFDAVTAMLKTTFSRSCARRCRRLVRERRTDVRGERWAHPVKVSSKPGRHSWLRVFS